MVSYHSLEQSPEQVFTARLTRDVMDVMDGSTEHIPVKVPISSSHLSFLHPLYSMEEENDVLSGCLSTAPLLKEKGFKSIFTHTNYKETACNTLNIT